MTKNVLTIAMLTVLFVTSCKEAAKQENIESKTTEQTIVTKKEVLGTYEGTTPGANSLIKETLSLNADSTFVQNSVYVDKGNEIFTEKGTYKIENGNVVLNVNQEKASGYYKIFDDYVLKLDISGKEITGENAEMYKMKKIK